MACTYVPGFWTRCIPLGGQGCGGWLGTPIGLELSAGAPKAGCTPVGPVSIPAGHICWDSKVAFGRAPWECIPTPSKGRLATCDISNSGRRLLRVEASPQAPSTVPTGGRRIPLDQLVPQEIYLTTRWAVAWKPDGQDGLTSGPSAVGFSRTPNVQGHQRLTMSHLWT